MSQSRTCTVAIGSNTHAMKAQAVLAAAAIPSSVIKIDASKSSHGCLWGLSVSAAQENNIKTVLASARIPIKALWKE